MTDLCFNKGSMFYWYTKSMHVEILIFLGLYIYDKVFQSLKKTQFFLCVFVRYTWIRPPIFSHSQVLIYCAGRKYMFWFYLYLYEVLWFNLYLDRSNYKFYFKYWLNLKINCSIYFISVVNLLLHMWLIYRLQ